MDIAVMLLLDRNLPGISPDDLEGRQIFAEQKLLDNLAEKCGVQPLSDFTSMDEVDCADFLGDDIEGLDEIGLTLKSAEAIQDYERRARQQWPWLFDAIQTV